MIRSSPASFAIGAGAVSAVGTPAVAIVLRSAADGASEWGVLGFLAMALPAVACGAWLAREHGRLGASFMVALGTGWALRAAFLVAVVVAALRRGPGALSGSLTGLAAGFVALTAFEMIWFARQKRGGSFSAERGA